MTAPDSVVIGGWGVWLRERARFSHDIDLIVTHEQLHAIATRSDTPPLESSARHAGGRKWAADWNGVHLDLYVPYQSRLGTRLQLRVEDLIADAEALEGHRVLSIPAQIASKWAALADRHQTSAGSKDVADLRAMLRHPDATLAGAVLYRASAAPSADVTAAIRIGFRALYDAAPRAEQRHLRKLEQAWISAGTDGP